MNKRYPLEQSGRWPRRRVTLECLDRSRTEQQHIEDCDINNIVERHRTAGILPDIIRDNPQYGDFAAMPDYMEAQGMVLRAQEQFAALSSRVRERFNNDPARFLAFATDARNADEMVSLGLLTKVEVPKELDPPAVGKKSKKLEADASDS